MSRSRGRSLTAVLLALIGGFVILFLAVAFFAGASASAGATLSNGRTVTINSNSWSVGLEADGNTCRTRTAGRTIEIVGDTVSIDGRQLATMDPGTKNVDVTVGRGQITFVADGQAIATCPR